MKAQTSVDFIKRNITKHYKKLTKEQINEEAFKIQRALDVVESHFGNRTFKGLKDSTLIQSKVMREGIKAREQFILSHLPFCFQHCSKFSQGDVQKLEELLQESFVSLGRAAELFDPTKGYASTTFVAFWLYQGSLTYLRTSSSSFKISASIYALRNKILKEMTKAKEENRPLPTKTELSLRFNESAASITKAMNIFIEVSGDEPESDGSMDKNTTKFEQIANPVNHYKETVQHYSDTITDRNNLVKNPLAFTLFADVIDDLKHMRGLSAEQESRINDFLKVTA